MKNLVMGIVAHVDAGKTTLSERMLQLGNTAGKPGQLDTYELERARGITIFSKQAILETKGIQITLLDTPGHVDFSAEMERTLPVLDYAVLVISGKDGVQGHTKTLWDLLRRYGIPVFLFINKMDQSGAEKKKIVEDVKNRLSDGCIDFEQTGTVKFYEQLALCGEALLEDYLETGDISIQQIQKAIKERRVFPCFFGSALKSEGVKELMQGIADYTIISDYPKEFAGIIYKITRDDQGNRLTHMKITGGSLKVKDLIKTELWEEKVNQIRLYSGEKFDTVQEIKAGAICTVTGLSKSRRGEGLGTQKDCREPVLEPVLSYQVILPSDCDPGMILPKLYQLEEEEPQLHIVWEERLQEIQAQIMGEVQIEILQNLIESRFGILVTFGTGRILYKETIKGLVEGAGHFEPLRHYGEVHVLLESGEAGSGLQIKTDCSEELLSKSWQKLILTYLEEKTHRGVLTGSEITDMKITLVSGRVHNKHTQGGDLREAACRAVRQGLKEAHSILLEPFYSFELEVPEKMLGRAMSDIERMYGTCEITRKSNDIAVLGGSAPVITMRNYQKEVAAYTKGFGRLFCSLKGYEPCHNEKEVIETIGYEFERDMENPSGSIFYINGGSFLAEWDKVKEYMHVESCLPKREELPEKTEINRTAYEDERGISLEEIDQIINNTFYANQGKKSDWKRSKTAGKDYYKGTGYAGEAKENREDYLLVDGYNIIYAWPELKELTDENMDAARTKLLDFLSGYQKIRGCSMIVAFDAYRVQGHFEEMSDYKGIRVVYTKEAQTADQYIEKFAHDNKKKLRITVATSDGLEQIIIRGAGASLLSARELKWEMEDAVEKIRQEYEDTKEKRRGYLIDALSEEGRKNLLQSSGASEEDDL